MLLAFRRLLCKLCGCNRLPLYPTYFTDTCTVKIYGKTEDEVKDVVGYLLLNAGLQWHKLDPPRPYVTKRGKSGWATTIYMK